MASTLKHLRSSTTNKRPTASGLSDGQIAINTASGTPALFFKDNADNIVKVGPVHVGATAPNTSPAGSAGNSTGELWVDDSLTTKGLKYYSGAAFVNLTPSGTTSEAGLVELATNAETQTGSDAVRAVTPAGLQSKVSDSTSTTSSTTIASATAVKSAYDLANAALSKTGGTVTGEIVISPSGSLAFEGSTDDSFETRIAVTNPTADRTITLPNTTGTVITTGDTGTVTSTMIVDGTIVNADINASAAIAPSKLGSGALPSGVTVSSTNIVDGTIVNADVNASAAIAGSKISPNFAGQNVVTTGSVTGASLIPSSATVPTNGVYLPAANSVGISTNGTGRLFIDANGSIGINRSSISAYGVALGPAAGQTTALLGISAGNNTGTSRIDFGDTDSNDIGRIQYEHSIDALLFRANGSERMRISSSGHLGLGTSSPASLLHLSGANVDTALKIQAGTAVPTIELMRGSNSTFGGDATYDYRLKNEAGDFTLQNGVNSTITDLVTVTATSNVGIGTTSPSYQLQLSTDSAGKPSTNTWTIVSDERIKEEIELADLDLCYEAVKNIPLKRFKWKDEVYTEDQVYDRRKLGWIAQDVEAVFPKAVRQHEFKYNQVFEEVIVPAVPAELDEDGNVIIEEQPERIEKGELISEEVIEDCRDLNSDQLYAAMYGAIQKLIGKVETLEAEIAALKA